MDETMLILLTDEEIDQMLQTAEQTVASIQTRRQPSPPIEETELLIDGDWNCEVPSNEYSSLKDCRGLHEWETYIGFTDSFEYCRLCDIRRDEYEKRWAKWETF